MRSPPPCALASNRYWPGASLPVFGGQLPLLQKKMVVVGCATGKKRTSATKRPRRAAAERPRAPREQVRGEAPRAGAAEPKARRLRRVGEDALDLLADGRRV